MDATAVTGAGSAAAGRRAPGRRGPTRTVLGALFTRDTWARYLYALLGAPLGAVGFGYVVVTLVVGTALSITFVGLPLVAAGLAGARELAALHRGLARRLLGVRVDAPPRRRAAAGFLGWLQRSLRDPAGWRAHVYLMLKLPVGVVTLALCAGFLVYGLELLTYPLWWFLLPDEDAWVHTGPLVLLQSLAGLVLLVAAPWVARGVLAIDALLVRGLLGPSAAARRIVDLEASRARAVDDAASDLRRIERDLHDGTQARLVALTMRLGMMREELAGDDPRVAVERSRALAETAHSTAREALAELRDLVRGIHPPALDSGLGTALATLAAHSAVPVDLRVDLPRRPSPAIETIAYFCAAELLTNVARHSGATRAAVEVGEHAGRLRLSVTDDGHGGARVGSAGAGAASGTGLAGLTDRVRTVDGELRISSPPGGPTTVVVDLPSHA